MKTSVIGQRVAYTGTFVKSFQLPKDVADLKGSVTAILKHGKIERAVILWDDSQTSSALLCNICEVKSTAHINSDLPQSVH